MEIKDVEALAELSKLELTEEEKKKILSDMEGILAYIKQIEEVDVPEIDTKYENHNSWREDMVREEKDFSLELIAEQFPDSKDGFVKVKKIL
ncbi:MAG: aspartyl-tRNA(Asn)/glutamyl-tRNA(Gln) amidotransferase subunit [Patescibacteria group bacterium]|nr:aspartyl-tRNA(Asn)/glutamyl-tRNA(Gln) amidotransferase subunit [Patescibacteria group bacterium]